MKTYLTLCCLLPFFSCQAATESLVFTLQPGSATEISLSASTGGSDSATLVYTGTILADLTFDEISLVPQSISFTGGAATTSDFSLGFPSRIFVDGAGTQSVRISLSARRWRQTLSTPNPPGQINATTGLVVNSEHLVTLSGGFTSTTIDIPGLSFTNTETVNHTNEPDSSVLSGESTVRMTEVSASLFERNVLVALTSAVNEIESSAIDSSNLTLTGAEQGRYLATAQVTIPTPYGQWALDNSLVRPLPSDTNDAGIGYGLLFAFRLSARATSIPIQAVVSPSGPKVEVTLPDSGLAASLQPYYSPNLQGDFVPLATDLLDDGAQSLGEGETGVKTISFPAGTAGFLRLVSTP